MFSKLSPQKVRHSDGYIVQVADRQRVEYVEPSRKASVGVDFGKTVGIYAGTLDGWTSTDGTSPISAAERVSIIGRIKAGLEAMGSTVDIC